MSIKILFATGVGEGHYPELAMRAQRLFNNAANWGVNDSGYSTTLISYSRGNGKALIVNDYSEEDLLIVKDIEKAILEQAENFFVEYGHTYDKDVFKLEVVNLWLNDMTSGSYHSKHSHYGNFLSGCFYVSVPHNAAGITFYGPLDRIDKADTTPNNFTVFNSHTWTVMPEEGNMLMWESYLQHEVFPSQFTEKRRSIAFDVSLNVKD